MYKIYTQTDKVEMGCSKFEILMKGKKYIQNYPFEYYTVVITDIEGKYPVEEVLISISLETVLSHYDPTRFTFAVVKHEMLDILSEE